jgi:hypothetical protein
MTNWVFLVSESRLSAPRSRGDDPPLHLGVRGLGIETVGTQIAERSHRLRRRLGVSPTGAPVDSTDERLDRSDPLARPIADQIARVSRTGRSRRCASTGSPTGSWRRTSADATAASTVR